MRKQTENIMNRHRPIETLAVFLLLGSPIICLAEPTLSNVVIKIDNDTTLSAKAFWPYGDLETAEIRNDSNGTIITAGKVSHADGYLHSGSAIEISLQMPEEIGVSEFSCRGQVIGFTNHWPVLADVNFIFSHVNAQPMRTMEKAGFIEKIGAENFQPHIDDALARAQEILSV